MRICENGIYRDMTNEEMQRLEEYNKNNAEIVDQPTLEERIETLEKENKIQDELINVTMMATDEMFMMLEPLLINTLSETGEDSLMKMYKVMIERGLKTLDQVPLRYREQLKNYI